MSEYAKICYDFGNQEPYDEGQAGDNWMLRAARGIVSDLMDIGNSIAWERKIPLIEKFLEINP